MMCLRRKFVVIFGPADVKAASCVPLIDAITEVSPHSI